MTRSTQKDFFGKQSKAYGGVLLKTRKGRSLSRPLSTNSTMHLVMRSSKAKGKWSFKSRANEIKIRGLVAKFSLKNGIKVLSLANVGNHLHFHIKLSNRYTYNRFIRGLTASIAMAVTGASRWNPLKKKASDKFWDYRPFTRIIESYKYFLILRDYIQINNLEGIGVRRLEARFILEKINLLSGQDTS